MTYYLYICLTNELIFAKELLIPTLKLFTLFTQAVYTFTHYLLCHKYIFRQMKVISTEVKPLNLFYIQK